jgi:hypothetical protein
VDVAGRGQAGCRSWPAVGQDLSRWRRVLGKARAHLGLYSRYDDDDESVRQTVRNKKFLFRTG